MSLLQVKNLVVEFPNRRGTLRALDDISFDIAPGEILGVVGESGAGKSLTGASIIGLLEPPGRVAGGQILLEGRRIDNLPPAQMRQVRGRQIGAIFQPVQIINDPAGPGFGVSHPPGGQIIKQAFDDAVQVQRRLAQQRPGQQTQRWPPLLQTGNHVGPQQRPITIGLVQRQPAAMCSRLGQPLGRQGRLAEARRRHQHPQ